MTDRTPTTAFGKRLVNDWPGTLAHTSAEYAIAIEDEARAPLVAALDPVTLAKALRVIADIDYPVDWSNWLGGEGTASAALAGLQTAEAVAAEYERLSREDRP
jgi:hypothetical protein